VKKKRAVELKQQKGLLQERSILAELDHPFVIKFIRTFRGEKYVYFLMELVTGGELLNALEQIGLLNRVQANFYSGCLTLALEFLAKRRIAYLDLKGENCLIDQHGYVKIIDFGVASRVQNGRIHEVKGTPLFMAPEVVRGNGYTTTADLWSLGVMIYDFMFGRFPFGDENTSSAQVFRKVLKAPLKFRQGYEERSQDNRDAVSVIRGLLTREPEQRLAAGPEGFDALKKHPWFNGFSWDGLLARQISAPYLPGGEIYAEAEEAMSDATPAACENEQDSEGENEDWHDPDPTWQDEFA